MLNLLSIITFLPAAAALIGAVFLHGEDETAQRNAKWLARLRDEIAPGKTVVAVGALHLPGENGLLKGLEDAGYTLGLLYR